ncbi:MAG TPA: outer membrane beta-barrel family protein, partial [Ferruginibacter sp.]|nr:outer membrane beta-barrel family protein [Ferruginibacter sp.]
GDFSALLNGVDKDLGNIRLKRNEKNLLNVTVVATRPLLQLNADKKVYAVDKDLMSTGGTAVDVMKNIPSVQVDIEGNVTMRNGSPQILIDGRPTAMSLDQIPADQIATIEVISNPSAKYDAGTNSGVLNIVLKKNRNKGYNGNLRAGIDSRLRPNLGGDFNLRRNKFNFFVSGMINFRKSKSEVESNRSEWGLEYLTHLQQQNNPVSTGYFAFGRAGMDYFIDNRNTVTLSGSLAHGEFNTTDRLLSKRDSVQLTGSSTETGIRNIASKAHFTNRGASLSFKHNFAKAEKEWTADVTFNDIHNDNISRYNNQFFDASQLPKGPQVYEQASGAGSTRMFTAQTDYVTPFGKKQKIEAGLRWTHRLNKSFNDNYIGLAPDQLIYIPELLINYRFTDDVYAGYLNYIQNWSNYSMQLGLRAESSSFDANLLSKNQPFSTQYPISLFPSVYVTHKLNSRQELQLNYSRKINRPGFFQLIPFTDYSDSLNLSVGNPNLQPEFSHLAELVFVNNFKSNQNLLISAYGKLTDQLITRYQYRALNPDPAKSDSVLYTSFANANRSWVTGLEITSKNKLTKWWELTTNLNLFYVTVEAGNIAGSGTQSQSSWFAKMNHSFKLPARFSLQLNGDYQAKTILPSGSGSGSRGMGGGMSNMWMGASISNAAQGYIKPIYGLDIALKKDF